MTEHQQPTHAHGQQAAAAAATAAADQEPYVSSLSTVAELAEVHFPMSHIDSKNPRASRGLSSEAASELLAQYGPNALSERRQTPAWVKFLLLFLGGFQLFLQGAGILCFVAYSIDPLKDVSNVALGVALFLVVILTNVFQHAQDSKTGAMMAQFRKEGQGTTLTVRDGNQSRVDSVLLVPGDVVILKEGDKIAADFRLLEVQGFKVDQSALTGESVQITKTSDRTDDPTFRSSNLALSGTNIAVGQAVALVIQTGDRTYNGHMAHLVVDTVKRESLLKRNIRKAVHVISAGGVVLAAVILVAGLVQRFTAVNVILLVIGAVLANLPEGLLPTLTLCLALAAKRMRDVNVLVKNMESVETLGACSAICTDKTGTLTQNVMTVVKVWFDGSVEDTSLFDDPQQLRATAGRRTHQQQQQVTEEEQLQRKASEHLRNPRYNTELRRTESQLVSSAASVLSSGSRRMMAVAMGMNLTALGRKDRTESRRLVDQQAAGGPTAGGMIDVVVGDPMNASNAGKAPRGTRSFHNLSDFFAVQQQQQQQQALGTAGSRGRGTGSKRELASFDQFLHCCALCSSAEWDNRPGLDPATQREVPFAELPIQRRGVVGDASETAIMRFAEQALVSSFDTTVMQQRQLRRKVGAIPFNSRNKWMAVVVQAPEDQLNVLYLKGGFDRVWDMCSKVLWGDRVVAITEEHRRLYKRDSKALSRQGMRLLAMAFAPLDPAEFPFGVELWNQEEELWHSKLPIPALYSTTSNSSSNSSSNRDLVFIGLVAIQDPPKVGVLEAVNECHAADVKVVMVTGDHPETAKAIAQQLNILQGPTMADLLEAKGIEEPTWDQIRRPPPDLVSQADQRAVRGVVVTGDVLAGFDEDEWRAVLLHDFLVFARTSPEQKLLIVQHFQDLFGSVVAATGDGVNDSPALRQANVGVCMGISGADVTRETADIVLMDDNFASIVSGIAEGRLMYENLKKSVAYTLIHMVAEITPFLLNAFAGFPLALTTIQILCIDLGTEMVTAVSFGHEPAEDLIMRVPPRRPEAPLISARLLLYSYLQMGCLETLASILVFLWVFRHEGYPLSVLPRSAATYWANGSPPVPLPTTSTSTHVLEAMPPTSNDHDLFVLHRAQSAYFLSVVLCQAACAMNTRTIRSFLWRHGLWSNRNILVGVVFGVCLASFIIYTPGVRDIFHYGPLPALYWAYCLPSVGALLAFDLLRKCLFNLAPQSMLTRMLSF